jgi:hypothetical protein
MYKFALEADLTFNIKHVATSAPGHPYAAQGIQTKGEAVLTPLHEQLMRLRPDPIWKSTPKGLEALPIEDLLDGKLRTFAQVGVYFAAFQKHYFEDQNERMKKIHTKTWGKYGYVKQFGGFHRLMKAFEKFATVWMGDISGWDRLIALMRTYKLRTRGLLTNPKFKKDEVYDWTVENTVRPVIAMGDGSIWRRNTGNNSGSNNTTTDNTIAHTDICFDFAIRIFHRLYGRLPSYEEALEMMFAIFGDDFMGGAMTNLGFSNEREFYEFVRDHYQQRWGLTIKEKAFTVIFKKPGEPFSGMEFLGSTCRYHKGIYVAYPRLGKLMFSISSVYSGEEESADVLSDKIQAIWDLVSFTDLTDIKNALSSYAKFIYEKINKENIPIGVAQEGQLINVSKQRKNSALILGYERQRSLSFSPLPGGRGYRKRHSDGLKCSSFIRPHSSESAPTSE